MKLSPLDIRRQTFQKKFRGYDPLEVSQFLDLVAAEMEQLQADFQSVSRKAEEMETLLQKYSEIERHMNDALVEAKKTGEMSKLNAEREGTLIVREAEAKAADIMASTRQQLAKVESDLELLRSQKESYLVRFRSLMRSQLELVNLLSAEDQKPARAGATPSSASKASPAEIPARRPGPEDQPTE
jgi:cell division initiation protein